MTQQQRQAPALIPNEAFGQMPSEAQVERAVAALSANGIKVIIVNTGEEAKARLYEILPPGAEVGSAISTTLQTLGITKELNESGRWEALALKQAKMDYKTQGQEIKKLVSAPAYAVGSVHAVTEDGHLLTGSGSASQLGPYAYGAGKVVLIVGVQKIVKDIAAGLRRLDEYVLPLEDARMKGLKYPGANLRKILIVKKETPERTTVILVRQKIGF